MNLISIFKSKILLILSGSLIASVLFGYAYIWHKGKIDTAVKTERMIIEAEYNSRLLTMIKQKEEMQLSLNKKLLESERKKNAEIARINAKHATIVAGLRNRTEERLSDKDQCHSTTETGSTKGATGVQLARPDAEFLVWFSTNTARMQAELKSCLQDYENARKQLDDFNNSSN